MKDIICNAHYSPTYHYDWVLFAPALYDKNHEPMIGHKRTERLQEVRIYEFNFLKIPFSQLSGSYTEVC